MNARLERLRLQIVASESAALIGARIRGAREEKDWTRRELARRMDGIATENDIYRWEKGQHRPRDDALAAAARALEVPLTYFFKQPTETPDLSVAAGQPAADLAAVLDRLDRIERQLGELLSREQAPDTVGRQIHEAFEEMANRLGREVGRRPPRSTRTEDHPPEAPPFAA